MVCNQHYNILIKEKFHNRNLNVGGNREFASHFPPLYIQNLNMSHNSTYKYCFAGGAFYCHACWIKVSDQGVHVVVSFYSYSYNSELS